jgi:hypothetical protein
LFPAAGSGSAVLLQFAVGAREPRLTRYKLHIPIHILMRNMHIGSSLQDLLPASLT